MNDETKKPAQKISFESIDLPELQFDTEKPASADPKYKEVLTCSLYPSGVAFFLMNDGSVKYAQAGIGGAEYPLEGDYKDTFRAHELEHHDVDWNDESPDWYKKDVSARAAVLKYLISRGGNFKDKLDEQVSLIQNDPLAQKFIEVGPEISHYAKFNPDLDAYVIEHENIVFE